MCSKAYVEDIIQISTLKEYIYYIISHWYISGAIMHYNIWSTLSFVSQNEQNNLLYSLCREMKKEKFLLNKLFNHKKSKSVLLYYTIQNSCTFCNAFSQLNDEKITKLSVQFCWDLTQTTRETWLHKHVCPDWVLQSQSEVIHSKFTHTNSTVSVEPGKFFLSRTTCSNHLNVCTVIWY